MEKDEKMKSKRIGGITFGIMLIVFGITFFVQSVFNIEVSRYISMFWPIIFICLGVETLYYNAKSDIIVKYDIRGTIFLFVIISFGMMLGIINFYLNKASEFQNFKDVNINFECGDDLKKII